MATHTNAQTHTHTHAHNNKQMELSNELKGRVNCTKPHRDAFFDMANKNVDKHNRSRKNYKTIISHLQYRNCQSRASVSEKHRDSLTTDNQPCEQFGFGNNRRSVKNVTQFIQKPIHDVRSTVGALKPNATTT